jgi:hypothetical protein
MGTRVVAMPLIPTGILRGSVARTDLRFAQYGRATWEWWCRRNGAEFVVLDRPLGDAPIRTMVPEFQRWVAIEQLLATYGSDTRVALVDADTMIRWDAPDLFEAAGDRFAAVPDFYRRWICRDIKTYQSLFPGVRLPWWEYFNAGLVVLGAPQLPVMRRFLDFVVQHSQALEAAEKTGGRNTGTDQTPLNFFVHQSGEPVRLLPPPYNLLHCVQRTQRLHDLETGVETDPAVLIRDLREQPGLLDFIDQGYVWHFNNVVEARRLVMSEVWRAVAANYPGAELPADGELAVQSTAS